MDRFGGRSCGRRTARGSRAWSPRARPATRALPSCSRAARTTGSTGARVRVRALSPGMRLLLRGVCCPGWACGQGGLPDVCDEVCAFVVRCARRESWQGLGLAKLQVGHLGLSADPRPHLLGQAGAGGRAAEGARAAGHPGAACARLAGRRPCRSECSRGAERSCAPCAGRSRSEQPASCTSARAAAQLRRRSRSCAVACGCGRPGRCIGARVRADSGRRRH